MSYSSAARSQQWIIPPFVLQKSSNIYVVADPPIGIDGSVVDVATARNKVGGCGGVAVAELDPIARAGVVGRPGLIAVTFSANRTPDEVALSRIQIMVEAVPVIELTKRCERLARQSPDLWSIGVCSLETQIQLRQFGKSVSGKFPERKPLGIGPQRPSRCRL